MGRKNWGNLGLSTHLSTPTRRKGAEGRKKAPHRKRLDLHFGNCFFFHPVLSKFLAQNTHLRPDLSFSLSHYNISNDHWGQFLPPPPTPSSFSLRTLIFPSEGEGGKERKEKLSNKRKWEFFPLPSPPQFLGPTTADAPFLFVTTDDEERRQGDHFHFFCSVCLSVCFFCFTRTFIGFFFFSFPATSWHVSKREKNPTPIFFPPYERSCLRCKKKTLAANFPYPFCCCPSQYWMVVFFYLFPPNFRASFSKFRNISYFGFFFRFLPAPKAQIKCVNVPRLLKP